MLSTLVCSKCGEVRSVSDRGTILPYVCDGCRRVEGANPTGALPESMYHPIAGNDHEADVHEERPATAFAVEALMTPELRDNSATVEATIQMVGDLEEQLQVAKELSAGQTELIAQLEQKLEIVTEERDDAIEKYETLDKQWDDLAAVSNEIVETAERITAEAEKVQKVNDVLTGIVEEFAYRLGQAHAKEEKEHRVVVISGPFGYRIVTTS